MPRPKKQHLKRRKDGRYVCKWHGISFYANTEEEALRARAEYQKEASRPIQRNYMTMMEYAIYWMPIHKASVKASTYNAYVSILNTVLKPIASIYISQITSDDVSEAYSKLTGKSASYIHKAKILLTALLDSAYDAGYLERNPARASSVKPPKGSSGTHRAITQEERDLIKNTPHKMQVAAMIMLYAGLRRGEVIALDYSDIGDMITVKQAVSYTSNQPIVSSPKTESSVREVPVVSLLKPFIQESEGLVLKGKNGSYMTEQAFMMGWESYISTLEKKLNNFPAGKRWYGKIKKHKEMAQKAKELREQGKEEEAKKYDLPPWKTVSIRPHDLRHSYATWLRDAGVDMHQTIVWMGHSDEKMILKIYDHVGEERTQKAVNQLETSIVGMQNGMQNKTSV